MSSKNAFLTPPSKNQPLTWPTMRRSVDGLNVPSHLRATVSSTTKKRKKKPHTTTATTNTRPAGTLTPPGRPLSNSYGKSGIPSSILGTIRGGVKKRKTKKRRKTKRKGGRRKTKKRRKTKRGGKRKRRKSRRRR